MIKIGVKPSIIGINFKPMVFEVECDDESMGEIMNLTTRLEWLFQFLGFSQTPCNLTLGSLIELEPNPSMPMGGEAELLTKMDVFA